MYVSSGVASYVALGNAPLQVLERINGTYSSVDLRNAIVIVILRFLKRCLKAKRRAPAYSRALRRIKWGFQRRGEFPKEGGGFQRGNVPQRVKITNPYTQHSCYGTAVIASSVGIE